MGMKGKLYTMLKVKSDYGFNFLEKVLWWHLKDTGREEYIHYLIELRDGGYIVEKNKEQPIDKRVHYLTQQGYLFLEKIKLDYSKNLIKKVLIYLGGALVVALLNEFVHQWFE